MTDAKKCDEKNDGCFGLHCSEKTQQYLQTLAAERGWKPSNETEDEATKRIACEFEGLTKMTDAANNEQSEK